MFASLLAMGLLAGCGSDNGTYQGWVEGDYLLVASSLAGELAERPVAKGQRVARGDLLFRLESAYERASVQEANESLAQAENQLEDLKQGQRPSEIAAIQARLAEARTELSYARTDFERKKKLFDERTISEQELDQARTSYNTASQAVSRIQAELATAQLGGRENEVLAAQAKVGAAKAQLSQAQWSLDQKSRTAPRAALVFDTFYDPGEWVAAGQPVVSLLPPENVKVVFYLPETMAGTVAPGRQVNVSFDGAPEPVRAVVTWVADESEYTPPVIYSSQSRAKLVYRVEARPEPTPDGMGALRVGQPVDVTLLPQTAGATQ